MSQQGSPSHAASLLAIVQDLQTHLSWQRDNGWDGVPIDLELGRYTIEAPSPRPATRRSSQVHTERSEPRLDTQAMRRPEAAAPTFSPRQEAVAAPRRAETRQAPDVGAQPPRREASTETVQSQLNSIEAGMKALRQMQARQGMRHGGTPPPPEHDSFPYGEAMGGTSSFDDGPPPGFLDDDLSSETPRLTTPVAKVQKIRSVPSSPGPSTSGPPVPASSRLSREPAPLGPVGGGDSLRKWQPRNGEVSRELDVRLETLRHDIGDCQRCELAETRRQIVFGGGNSGAQIMLIGQSPMQDAEGANDVFAGPEGVLLRQMLRAVGLRAEQVYYTHVLKCRSQSKAGQSRRPKTACLESCQSFWMQQVAIVQPSMIITLGAVATVTVLQTNERPQQLWGNWHKYGDIPVLPIHAPDYLVRNPKAKEQAWDALRMLMDALH